MGRGVLQGDGTIVYPDAASLGPDVEAMLATGGLMVRADRPPPLRTPAEYTLRCAGVQTLTLKAEAVYEAGGQVGFQVLNLDRLRPQLLELRTQLQATQAPPAPAPPPRSIKLTGAEKRLAPTEAQLADRSKSTVEVFGVEWNLDEEEPAAAPLASRHGEEWDPMEEEEEQKEEEHKEEARKEEARKEEARKEEARKEEARKEAREAAPRPAPEAPPPGPSSEPAPEAQQLRCTGPLVPLLTVDEVIGSSARRAGIHEGEALPVVQVLIAAAELKAPCTLRLGGWRLQLARGHVVGATPPGGEISLHYLKRRFPRDQLEPLRREAGEKRVTVEYLALHRQLATRQELAKGFYAMLMDRAKELVPLTEGEYMLRGGLELQMGVAIPFERLAREVVRRSLHTLRGGARREWFGERMCRAVAPVGGQPGEIARFTAEGRYQRWLQRLSGRLPLREMFRQAPMAKEIAYELLIGLLALGRCELVKPRAGEVVDAVEVLTDLLAQLEGQGPFTALGLHWTVHPDEIEERIRERREEYGPDGELARDSAKAAGLARQVLQASEAAYVELRQPSKRAAARQQAASPDELETARGLLARQIQLARLRKRPDEERRLAEVRSELGGGRKRREMRLDEIK